MRRKITPIQYAIFLYGLVSGKEKHEIERVIKYFLEVLAQNNDLGKAREIIREFDIYEKKRRGVKDLEIITVEPLDSETKKQIVDFMGSAEKLEVRETVDPSIIGGLILLMEDTMIDGSLRKKLKELNNLLACGPR